MDDPWATWGKPRMSMPASLSPPPQDMDVTDPWAPKPAAASASPPASGFGASLAAGLASGQAAGASAFASAKEGLGSARERYGPAASSAAASAGERASAFMGAAKERAAGVDVQDVQAGISSGFASMGAGLASMGSAMGSKMDEAGFKMPTSEGMSSGFSSMTSKMSMPDTSGISSGFSSLTSKMSMPDTSGFKMPGTDGLSSGFSSMTSKMSMPDTSSYSLANPPSLSSVPDAPKFAVPDAVSSTLSSYQTKAQGAATNVLAGHIAGQMAAQTPGMPSAFTNMASTALASHMTSQASNALSASAASATASATDRANAFTSGLTSSLNSNISSFNSGVSTLSSAATAASDLAATGSKIGGLGAMPNVPSFPSWGDTWGSPTTAKEEVRAPTPIRSPSPEAFGDVWGADEKAPPVRSSSPHSESLPVRASRTPSPTQSPTRSPITTARSMASSPRKSLEARLSRELSRNLSTERRASAASGSLPGSPLKTGAVEIDVPDIALATASPISPIAAAAVGSPPSGFASFGDLPDMPDVSSSSLKLEADTSIKRSSSFGSDFGGFADVGEASAWGGSANDSWKKDDWGGDDSYGGAEEGYASWGGVRTATPPAQAQPQEERWAAAQRTIRLKEERAPFEKIEKLKREWDGVAASVIGEKDQLQTMDEDEEKKLDDGVKVLEENVAETLRSLTEVPDTRMPPIHTLTTHQQYTAALSRSTAHSSMSLLRMPMRPRRLEGLSFGPGLEGTWGDRSRLGEQDADKAAAPAAEEAVPSRWSFWKKSSTPKPLVTSGGGMLEVKTPSTAASTPITPQPPAVSVDLTAAAATAAAAGAPSGSARASISSAPRGSGSRPQSIIPSRPATPPVVPAAAPIPSFEDTGHEAPRQSLSEPDAQAPASRSFWRWGRRATPSTEQQAQTESESAQRLSGDHDEDIDLGEDDFAFLADVPSMPTPASRGTADLLGFGGPETLETVLQPQTKASPLAPPPRGSRGPPPRQSTFVARMATGPKKPQPSTMDLLSGLDFDAPPTSSPTQSRPSSTIGWDDILAPTAPKTPPILPPPPGPARSSTPPSIAPPPGRTSTSSISGANMFREGTPPLVPGPAPGGRPMSPASPAVSSPLAGMAAMVPGPPTVPSRRSSMVPSPGAASPRIPSPPRVASPPRVSSPPTGARVSSPPFSFTPLAPSAPKASPASAGSSAPLFPSMASLSVPGGGMSPASPLGPSAMATPISPMTASPMFASPLMPSKPSSRSAEQGSQDMFADLSFTPSEPAKTTPLLRPGLLPSTPANRHLASPATTIGSPAVDAPLLARPRTPARVAPSTSLNDDFGDFSDFADFSTAPAQTAGRGGDGFDDFGDFGEFTSFDSPAPPLPAKTPWTAPRGTTTSSNSPAPTPPSKSPYARPVGSAHSPTASPTPANRRGASVDHTATLNLLSSAKTSPGRWPAIPPPSGAPAPQTSFLPPPPGSKIAKKKTADLLDLDDLMG